MLVLTFVVLAFFHVRFLEAELQASKAQYERRREEVEKASAAERERLVSSRVVAD